MISLPRVLVKLDGFQMVLSLVGGLFIDVVLHPEVVLHTVCTLPVHCLHTLPAHLLLHLSAHLLLHLSLVSNGSGDTVLGEILPPSYCL